MHLIRKTVVLAMVVFASACHDAAGPPPIPTNYLLSAISGRPLPTFFSPVTQSPTITYAALVLDGAGHAVLTEHQQGTDGTEVILRTSYSYLIVDNTVHFQVDCPPGAACIRPPIGTLADSHLLLDMTGGDNQIVFDFQQVALD